MPFLTFSNADIQFVEKELTWRFYAAAKALPTTKRVELIDIRKFAKAALDEESETFLIYVAALEALLGSAKTTIHPAQAAKIAALRQDKALTEVSTKYTEYADEFSFDQTMELPENTGINKHTIKLEIGKQAPYGLIYSLGSVKLEILKIYIKTYLKTDFIWPFKSPAGTTILFDKKLDGSFWLCVNYQGINNPIIKNWYPLPLINEALDRLGRAKWFT